MPNDVHGGDIIMNPKHDGCHVPDGRPGSSGVGGNDDDTPEYPTFPLLRDQTPQEHYHDNSSCQIVQNRGQNESKKRDDPKKFSFISSRDSPGE